jgi:hypothetical protein
MSDRSKIEWTTDANLKLLLPLLYRNAVPWPAYRPPPLTPDRRHRLAVELVQARAFRREHPDWYLPRGSRYLDRQLREYIKWCKAQGAKP